MSLTFEDDRKTNASCNCSAALLNGHEYRASLWICSPSLVIVTLTFPCEKEISLRRTNNTENLNVALCIRSYELVEGYQYRRYERLHLCNFFFYNLIFIGRTSGPHSIKLGSKHFWLKVIHFFFWLKVILFSKRDDSDSVKIHWQLLKFYARTTVPISTKLLPWYHLV